MSFRIVRRVATAATAVHPPCVKEEVAQESGRICLPFILEALRAFAGPAPDAEPNIQGQADNPKGIPCA